jgi:hypothetical protein
MATQKFKKYYSLMTEQNKDLFDQFEIIHSAYVEDKKTNEKKFHKIGLDVVDIVRFWERKLCSGMERGNNAVYSDKLADKFWNEVRTRYSHIDMVGLK